MQDEVYVGCGDKQVTDEYKFDNQNIRRYTMGK